MLIIKCPFCTLYGEKRNLAEVIPGGLKIMRSMNGVVEYTIVKTTDYSVICGTCGNLATYKQTPRIDPALTGSIGWGTLYTFYEKNSLIW